ncbi:MAG: 16S rRNA (guanine(527)-N(7))-methyltransferase RsmG [Thermoguttaceae bacterium]|jgi:16S rRNA (guanine527-N7)-methyltransferase
MSDENHITNSSAEIGTESESSASSLSEVLAQYQIKLSAKQIDLIDRYCRALWEWNTKINLTRHDDYEKFVTRDVVDSMQLAALLQQGEHVLDVGTGGGVPGILLAILRPDLNVELCDATGKKAKAVGAIVDEIGLELNVWHAKAEELLKVHRFHTLVVRAVSKLDRLLTMFAPTWFAFDRILMIKGPSWVEERGEARHFGRLKNLALRKVADYTNPGIERQSVILQVCRKNRLAEIEQRAKDLAAGLPIQDRAEVVAVETESGSARQTGGPRPSRREGPHRHDHGRPDRRKFQGPGGSARRPDRPKSNRPRRNP